MTGRARSLIAACALIVVAAGAAPAAATTARRNLPPPDRADLARIFNPELRPLGLRTSRALLQNLGNYYKDPKGRHLAVYVEPIDDSFSKADYVDRFTKVAKIFLPMVYERWKGLKSFDVCIEPLDSEDASAAPPPVTQILVTRRGVGHVNWETADLADMLEAAEKYKATETSRASVYVFFDDRLIDVPELRQARQAFAAR